MIAAKSFRRDIATDNIYMFDQHKEAFARLKYVINSKGFGVLTGEPGTGKSSIIRILDSSIDRSRYHLCYINDSELKPKFLYSHILHSLSVKPFNFLDKVKKQFKESAYSMSKTQGKLLILVIDNAQDIPERTIAEIRYLLNFETDSYSPLSIILVGQPELWDTLKLRTFEPVFQCISNHYRLIPLDFEQTKDYIKHQLKLSQTKMLFPDDVVEKIHSHSKGHPRIINNICRHCLIDVESNKLDLVDSTVLDKVLGELFH